MEQTDIAEITGPELGTWLMEHFFLQMCEAAIPQIALGVRFLWYLDGEVSGSFIMELSNENIAVESLANDAESIENDGIVKWTLSKEELVEFFSGQYKLADALRNDKIQFQGSPAGFMNLSQVFLVLAGGDIMAMRENAKEYFQKRLSEPRAILRAEVPKKKKIKKLR